MSRPIKLFSVVRIILITFLLGSCGPTVIVPTNPPLHQATNTAETPAPTTSAQATLTQPDVVTPVNNPLTGLPVADPSLLQIPAALVSISHFPVEARPQAGLSFAPYVFEIYITEGATRFLTTFYGEFPAPEVAITGSCEDRKSVV